MPSSPRVRRNVWEGRSMGQEGSERKDWSEQGSDLDPRTILRWFPGSYWEGRPVKESRKGGSTGSYAS